MFFKNFISHLTLKNMFGFIAILLILLMIFFKDKFNAILLITLQLFAVMSYFGLGTLENIRKGIIKISFGNNIYYRDTQPKQF
ncbi:MAG: hypothetical protein GY860_14485 [Desulfobacteraceae bacterium]|nr:hypothetical protein [Desulfobacteraceae bacterium]